MTTSLLTRPPSLELGVRYYDNSKHSGSILGGERGMLREHGFRERARTHRAGMVGDNADYTGLRFAFKKQKSEGDSVQPSRRQTLSKLRKKESRLHFWKSFFSSLNILGTLGRLMVRVNPLATYHATCRWSTR